MYTKFYNLTERPFNVTSDPNFLFLSKHHKEALSYMVYGINEKKGFIEMTGEIGTGKTTLCRALLNQLDEHTKTAFILNPNLSEIQLLKAIIEDLGLTPKRQDKWAMLSCLNKFLIEQLKLGFNVVVIIDEAQNLRPAQLEHIRLLSNLETEKEKLLQIILVGQPELKEKLKLPGLEQIRQRIAIRYHIAPLKKEEVRLYINHRLSVAGSEDGRIVFSAGAIDEIYNYSGGTPRLINIVCDKALLLGYVLETYDIGEDVIKKSIMEIEGVPAI